jgi:hypothetical protein
MVALAIAAAACAGPTPAPAPAPAPVAAETWDQAAVTAIAKKLTPAATQLYQQTYDEAQEVSLPGTFSNSGEANVFLNDALMLEQEASHLATDLEKGKGRQDTIGSFQRLKELLDDARVAGEQQFEVEQITNYFEQVKSLIGQLEPYYVETR